MNQTDSVKFNATNYKISTITATCYINTEINLKNLFENIDIINENDNAIGIVYLEYGNSKYNSISKGTNSKKKTKQKKEKKIKRFDNQATARIKLFPDNNNYFINMKLFKNGNIQMTGIRVIEDGITCMNLIIDIISKYNEIINNTPQNIIDNILDNYNNNSTNSKYTINDDSINEIIDNNTIITTKIVDDTKLLKIVDYKIHLINCDFRVNFEIKRDDLKKLLIDTYKIKCFYEPCGYPGVKIEYFWNNDKDGVCKCPENCSNLKKKSKCKKITIAVFQSGCIIITGGNTINQVNYAYDFICSVIRNNITHIILQKKSIEDLKLLKSNIPQNNNTITDKDDIYYINKNNIINPFLLK